EIRNNVQNPNDQNTKQHIHAHKRNKFWSFAFGCFEFVSDFDIRISDFSARNARKIISKTLTLAMPATP
ncbi:MAG: hypothetical protein V2B19_00340, partial [Pseudomonadota bacterium]